MSPLVLIALMSYVAFINITSEFMLLHVRAKELDDDVCKPEVADTCFSDVHDDLRLIFDPKNHFAARPPNDTLLRDLCSAWDDSLLCTSDVIDDEATCASDHQRSTFHRWHSAFRTALEYVCARNATVLRDVFGRMDCFDVHDFFECAEKTASVAGVDDMLTTELNEAECRFLEDVTNKCSEYVSCKPDDVALATFKNVSNVFLAAACCGSSAHQLRAAAAAASTAQRRHYTFITCLLSFLLARFHP